VAVAVLSLQGSTEDFESLVDPERTISEAALAIIIFDPSMLIGQPKIHEVLPKLLPMIGEHLINWTWDWI